RAVHVAVPARQRPDRDLARPHRGAVRAGAAAGVRDSRGLVRAREGDAARAGDFTGDRAARVDAASRRDGSRRARRLRVAAAALRGKGRARDAHARRARAAKGGAAMRRCILLGLVMLCSAADGGFAQEQPRATEVPAPGGSSWSAALSLANVYEGNVNHDVTPLQSYGLVPAFDVAFATPKSGFTFAYEIADNRYTATNEWDRVSQAMESSVRRNVGKRIRLDATAEASFKGTSEDRELANMVGVSPRATFVLDKRTRVSVSGAWRYK